MLYKTITKIQERINIVAMYKQGLQSKFNHKSIKQLEAGIGT